MKEENSDNQLKDLFKGKFADEYLAPPKGAWSNIQGQMAAPGRIRKPLYYWLIPVGLLFIIGGGIAVNSIFSTEKAQTSSITNKTEVKDQINNNDDNTSVNEVEVNKENSVNANDSVTPNDKTIVTRDEVSTVNKSESQAKIVGVKNDIKPSTTNSLGEKANKTAQTKQKSQKATSIKSDNQVASNIPKTTTSSNSSISEKTISPKVVNTAPIKKGNNDMADQKRVDQNQSPVTSAKPDTKSENLDKPKSITQDKKAELNTSESTKSETSQSTVSKTSDEKVKIKEESSTTKNENTSEIKTVKNSELKNPEKEVVAPSPDEKIEKKTEPQPEKTESNVLLKSVAPRNNLRYDFYLGKGKSPRRSTFYENNVDDPAIYLADKSVNMNNTVMGFNVRYQITPYFAMRSGIAGGQDRIQTRLFSVTLANTLLDQNLKIASIDGIMQASGLTNNKLQSNGTDSSTYDMQIFHRQGYLTIPISFVVNTKIQPGKLYYYGSTGFDFMAKGKGRNLLIVKDGEESREVTLNRITDVSRIYTNWNLALGLAYPFKSRFDLFTEINYSLDISKRLKSSYLITNTGHVQVLLGLRF